MGAIGNGRGVEGAVFRLSPDAQISLLHVSAERAVAVVRADRRLLRRQDSPVPVHPLSDLRLPILDLRPVVQSAAAAEPLRASAVDERTDRRFESCWRFASDGGGFSCHRSYDGAQDGDHSCGRLRDAHNPRRRLVRYRKTTPTQSDVYLHRRDGIYACRGTSSFAVRVGDVFSANTGFRAGVYAVWLDREWDHSAELKAGSTALQFQPGPQFCWIQTWQSA